MKKLFLTILSAMMICSFGFFALTGCGGGEQIGVLPPPEIETYVTLSSNEKSLVVGDEEALIAYYPLIEGKTVVWSSSNESVATVKDGVITAVRPGTAEISATFADKKSVCTVSVSLGSNIPSVQLETNLVNNAINLAKNTSINLGAYVLFNGKRFDDAVFTYELADSTGITVDATKGIFTSSNQKVSTKLTIKASWRGIESSELIKVIDFNVVSNSSILIDQGKTSAIELFTVDSHGGVDYSIEKVLKGNIMATEDGVDMLSNLKINVVNNVAGDGSSGGAVSYNSLTQTITAKTYGTATLRLSFEGADGLFVNEFPITVTRPVAVAEKNVEMFSAMDGDIRLSKVFGKSVNLFDAYQNGNDKTGTPLTVKNNKVLGLTLSERDKVSYETVTLYTNKIGYEVVLEAYAKVLKTAQDFKVFAIEYEHQKIDGYFVLANDILERESVVIQHHGMHGASTGAVSTTVWNNTTTGFAGVFDGLGHSVSLDIHSYLGIFGQLQDGAQIKNVAFVNTKLTGYDDGLIRNTAGELVKGYKIDNSQRYVLYHGTKNNARNVLISNIYIEVTELSENATTYDGSIAYNLGYDKTDGIVVKYTAELPLGETIHGKGALFGNLYSSYEKEHSIVAFTEYQLSGQKTSSSERYLYGANEELGEKQVSVNGILRYPDYAAMAKDSGEHIDSVLAEFDPTYWDLSRGVPLWHSLDVGEITSIKANGENVARIKLTSGDPDNNSVVISTDFFGSELPFTLTTDSDIVTIDGNKVTAAAGGFGTAYVNVAMQYNGKTYNKVLPISILLPYYEDSLMYSSVDDQFFFTGDTTMAEVESIISLEDTSIYFYQDGVGTNSAPKNLTSTDLAKNTVDVIVIFKNGNANTASMVSYAGVFDEDTDLDVLVDENATADARTVVKGYYILANNIERSGNFKGNSTGTNASGVPHSLFAGTLDGNGYYIDLQLDKCGLVGGFEDKAVIKDLAIFINNKSTSPTAGAADYVIARGSYNMWGGKSYTISNVYVEVNVAPATGVTKICEEGLSSGARYENYIVKLADGIQTMPETGYTRGGVLWGYSSTAIFGDGGDGFKYVNTTAASNAKDNKSFKNSYFINSDYKFLARMMEGGDKRTLVVAENDDELYAQATDPNAYGYKAVAKVSGVKRYDNFAKMAEANLDLSAFSDDLWITIAGYPVWRTAPLKNSALIMINGENTDKVELKGGDSATDSAVVTADILGISTIPTLTVKSGEGIVTIDGNKITAVYGKFGVAVVTATFEFEGQTFEVDITVEAVIESIKDVFKYSSLDGAIYMEGSDKTLADVKAIYSVADSSIAYYANGAATANAPKNWISEDLSEMTHGVVVEFNDGKLYSAKMISYTMILTKDTDLEIFKEANHKTQSAEGHALAGAYEIVSSNPILRGYFLVNNDITLSGNWNGNYHDYNNKKAAFGGTFDGNGHVVELKLYSGGLFGALYGATIKNTAFIAKDLYSSTTASGSYSILANQSYSAPADHTIVSNVYAKYDLDEAVASRFNSYGRVSGLTLIANAAYYLDYNNVIFDASDLQISDIDAGLGYFGFVHASSSTTFESDSFRDKVTDNYFITSIPYVVHVPNSASYVVTEGTKFAGYGANETDAYNTSTATSKYQYKGIKRYNDYSAFATDKANNDFSTFNANVWDLSGAYPIFKSVKEAYFSFFYLGEELGGTEAQLASTGTPESVTVKATVGGKDYTPALEITSGNNFVTINGNVITAVAGATGTAIVTATYTIDGAPVVKTYTINVLGAVWEGEPVKFSSVDNKFHMPEEIAKIGVKSIVGADGKVWFEEGVASDDVPKNLDSTDLAANTRTAIITLNDNSIYSIDVVAYTKILTTAQDFKVFNIETETTLLKGYYLLANDITIKEDVEFTHHGLHSADTTNKLTDTLAWNATSAGFAGTFDGAGHKVTMNAKVSFGIFGLLQSGAVIKDVAFYEMTLTAFRDSYATNSEGTLISISNGKKDNWVTLLANSSSNNARDTYIQNVYVDVDTVNGFGTWGSGVIASAGYTNFVGVVVDFAPTISNNLHGALFAYSSPNESNRYKGLINITTQRLASNTGWQLIGCNEGYENNEVVGEVTYKVTQNIYRYADYAAVVADKANLESVFANYSTDLWDLSSGAPIFKGFENNFLTVKINGEASTSATVSAGAEGEDAVVTIDYNGTVFVPTLTTTSDLVVISGNTIKAAAGKFGTATVTYTYVNAGLSISGEITVSIQLASLGYELRYSTLTNELFVENNGVAISDISKIVGVDNTEYYTNGALTANVVKNYQSEDLEANTSNVIVELANGKAYSASLVSYTMVINEDTDFEIFNSANYYVYSQADHAYAGSYEAYSGTDGNGKAKDAFELHGYFIVNNDIVLSGNWDGNYHEYNAKLGVFKGTFDGNGHVVELVLESGGLFGYLKGATIKNTAFIVKDLKVDTITVGRYAILANQQMAGYEDYTIISNVYAKYDLDVPVTTKYQSYGRASGLSFISQNSYYVGYNNVVLDASELEVADANDLGNYGFTHSYSSSTYEADSFRQKTVNNYFITTLPFVQHSLQVKSNAFTGVVQLEAFGANETEAYNASTAIKYQYKGIKRYDSFSALAADKANNIEWYNTFDASIWSFENGYPEFKGLAAYNTVKEIENAEYYLGGNKNATEADLEGIAGNSIEIYSACLGSTFNPTLEVISGNSVTVKGNSVETVVGATGKSVVKATFNYNGTIVVKEFTINVTFAKLEGTLMFSTLDKKVVLPTSIKDKTVKSIVDAETETSYFADGVATDYMPLNTASNDLTDYTKEVVLTLSDNSVYTAELISYTKVITKDTDLDLLADETATSTETKDVAGYYILANNIERSGEFTGNNTKYSYFMGVLDGNGYYIDLQLNKYGLLGAVKNGAVVKDLAIIINNVSTTPTSGDANYILACNSYNMWGGNRYDISNVYCEVNVKFATGAAKFCEEGIASGVRYTNFVMKLADGVQLMAETGYTRGGAIWGYSNTSIIKASAVDGFNYVNTTGAPDSKNNASFKDSYFISSDYKFVARWIEGGDKRNCVVCENDAELYGLVTKSVEEGGYGYKAVGYISGIKRYDSATAMASANLDLSTFSAKCWDITSGAPVWKSL